MVYGTFSEYGAPNLDRLGEFVTATGRQWFLDPNAAPASVILWTESYNIMIWDWNVQGGDISGSTNPGSLWNRLAVTHNGGLNCGYGDGHAKWRSYNSLSTADFGALPAVSVSAPPLP